MDGVDVAGGKPGCLCAAHPRRSPRRRPGEVDHPPVRPRRPTVPNPTTSAIIRAGGLQDRTTLFRNDLAFASDPTFPPNPHTFLTRLPGLTTSAGAAAVAVAAQDQIAAFFASGGTTVVDPDGAGPLFETPMVGPPPEDLAYIP